jgi:hypothetical protein
MSLSEGSRKLINRGTTLSALPSDEREIRISTPSAPSPSSTLFADVVCEQNEQGRQKINNGASVSVVEGDAAALLL